MSLKIQNFFLISSAIRSIMTSLLSTGIDIGNKSDLEDKLMGAAVRRGTVSVIYTGGCVLNMQQLPN